MNPPGPPIPDQTELPGARAARSNGRPRVAGTPRARYTAGTMRDPTYQSILETLNALPSEKVAEVEDFIDFLAQRQDDRQLARAVSALSERAVEKVWDNPDDAAYDQL